MDAIPDVEISGNGDFKYILINVTDPESNETKTIVRGDAEAAWHADIFDAVSAKLKPLRCKCPGGGRIDHNPDRKIIEVYGISQGYGKADHELAASMLKKQYPNYKVAVNADD